jgi:hypothetical protein
MIKGLLAGRPFGALPTQLKGLNDMKDNTKTACRQSVRLFTMVTRSENCRRQTNDLADEFESNASKLALQILLRLLRQHDARNPLPSQVSIAKNLGVAKPNVSVAFAEMVQYRIIYRCRVKECNSKEKTVYFLNPELYWSGSDTDR